MKGIITIRSSDEELRRDSRVFMNTQIYWSLSSFLYSLRVKSTSDVIPVEYARRMEDMNV